VLHRLHGGLDLVDGRDHDAFDEVVVLLDDAQDVEAADPREPDVEQDQVDVFVLEQAERGLAARNREHVVVALQDCRDRVAHPLIVVTDENGLRTAHRCLASRRGLLASRQGAFLRHCWPRGAARYRMRAIVRREPEPRPAACCRPGTSWRHCADCIALFGLAAWRRAVFSQRSIEP
jgi:hypothetical protein